MMISDCQRGTKGSTTHWS